MFNLKIKKILFTCRDPASTETIGNFISISNLINYKDVDFRIISQSPGFEIIKQKYNFLESKLDFLDITSDKKKLLQKCNNYTDFYDPICIITGISGPDSGLDEAFLNIANKKKIKSFAFQNYWGDFNYAFNSEPDCYLVLDEYAKKQTRKFSKKKIKIVGSIKNELFIGLNVQNLRQRYRSRINIQDEILFSFAGQPIDDKDYLSSINLFVKFISTNFKNSFFIYRPHPKENKMFRNYISEICKENNQNFLIENTQKTFEQFICGSDVLISVYSTCCYELQYLIMLSKKQLGVPLYLMSKKMKKYFKKYCELDEIPYSKKNMSILIENEKDLEIISDRTRLKKSTDMVYQSIYKNLKIITPNSNKILNYILKQLAN